ncbi:response regulator [Marinomonas colpomeniae]|uniref:Response regulator n=1 Tax=Marinomonas colpomeniae TaxID=2774408 RepID=A0ABR8NVL4_9GAMM|nr:response regulator [Marinomonas colpomeniae]MBD5770090.1 response regulator [Marinomonas colpomeniae]
MIPKTTSLLIVEDDDVDYKLLMRSFAQRKIANVTVRAKDGLDAWEKIKSGEIQKPFIVLLDLNMPRMNGKELLTEIRNDPDHADTVVFLMTTSTDKNDIKESFSKHAAGYFLKDNVQGSIDKMVEVIDGYWQIVILPS